MCSAGLMTGNSATLSKVHQKGDEVMRGFHNPNERPRGLRRARGGRQSTRSRPLRQSQTRRVDAVQLLRQLCRAASGPKASLISAVDGTLVPASHVDAAIRSTSTLLSHAGDLRPLVRSVEKGAHSTGEVLIREPAKLPSLHRGPPDPLSGSIPAPPPLPHVDGAGRARDSLGQLSAVRARR